MRILSPALPLAFRESLLGAASLTGAAESASCLPASPCPSSAARRAVAELVFVLAHAIPRQDQPRAGAKEAGLALCAAEAIFSGVGV